jgi:hypothetical protein
MRIRPMLRTMQLQSIPHLASPNGRTGFRKSEGVNTGSYIDGRWTHPRSERLVRNVNPADPSDVIAEFPAATAADARRAIEVAKAAAWQCARYRRQKACECSGGRTARSSTERRPAHLH